MRVNPFVAIRSQLAGGSGGTRRIAVLRIASRLKWLTNRMGLCSAPHKRNGAGIATDPTLTGAWSRLLWPEGRIRQALGARRLSDGPGKPGPSVFRRRSHRHPGAFRSGFVSFRHKAFRSRAPVALPDGPHCCRAPADRRRVPVKRPGLHRRTSPVGKARSQGPRGQPPLDRYSAKVLLCQVLRPSSSGSFPSFRWIKTAPAGRVAQGCEARLIPMSTIERWTSVDKSTACRKPIDPGAPAIADAAR